MYDSIQTSLCDELALENIVPVSHWQLVCEDGRLSVVPVIDDLFEVMLELSVLFYHSEVVYYEQVMCVELAEEVGLASFKVHKFEILQEHVHRKVQ